MRLKKWVFRGFLGSLPDTGWRPGAGQAEPRDARHSGWLYF